MIDLISNFLSSLEVESTRFRNHPSLIFLCGGPVPQDGRAYASARHYFLDNLKRLDSDLHSKIVLAEDLAKWHAGKHYNNLMQFEIDIASVAGLIVVFLESPGSIAELGAFSMVKKISERMIVFLQHSRHGKSSFINDGILRFIDDEDESPIYVYKWNIKEDRGEQLLVDPIKFGEQLDPIIEDVRAALQKSKPAKQFEKSDTGLQMLFLAQMVYLFGALGVKECAYIMKCCFDIDRNKTEDILYAVQNMNIIKYCKFGGSGYFVAMKTNNYCQLFLSADKRQVNNDQVAGAFRREIARLDAKRFHVIVSETATS